jgi:putative ABC transport system permease protein
LENNLTPFLNYLKGLKEVQSVGGVGAALGEREWDSMRLQPEGSTEVLTVKYMLMDDDFANTIGFKFTEGRAFSKQFNDSVSLILNEAAVRTLGLKSPIGQKLTNTSTRDDGTMEIKQFTIVGIVKDFNFQPLKDKITPLAIVSNESYGGFYPSIAVRLDGKNTASAVRKMEDRWKELAPSKLFRYSFLEQRMDKQYSEEQRSSRLFFIFSTLSIVIGCVGIFGLSMYTTASRIKELSIRKVLGASIGNLTIMLTKNFVKLILIAIAVAIPLAWWMMGNWLQSFAYRIEIGWDAFFWAGGAALLIPLVIVSYQSIKTVLANPIEALKSE